MQIIYDEYPPNYPAIAKAFNITNKTNAVFTYGHNLYVPGGRQLQVDEPLLRHEEVHAKQQTDMGIEDWWERYLVDSGFRFTQELEAYRVQYKAMATLPLQHRINYLNHIATDLAGAIYGNLVTKEQAMAEITKGIILNPSRPTSHKSKTVDKVRKAKKRQRQNRKKGRK